MSKRDLSHSFYKRLTQARINEESGEEPEVDPSSEQLIEEEEEDYKSQASSDPESWAEIKKAAAISDAKFSKLKRKLLKGQVTRQRQNIKMRKIYASKAYRFVWLWSIFFFIIILLSGYKDITFETIDFTFKSQFSLNDPVLIALITGVTVNIVAVFIIVMRNLFPSTEKEEGKAQEEVHKAEEKN